METTADHVYRKRDARYDFTRSLKLARIKLRLEIDYYDWTDVKEKIAAILEHRLGHSALGSMTY
jgi:hypothetical protein